MIGVLPHQVKEKGMQIPYRFLEKIKLNQSLKSPTLGQLSAADTALIWLPEKPGKALLAESLHRRPLAGEASIRTVWS